MLGNCSRRFHPLAPDCTGAEMVRARGEIVGGEKRPENRPLPSSCLSLAQPRRAFPTTAHPPVPAAQTSPALHHWPAGTEMSGLTADANLLEAGAYMGASERTGCRGPRRARGGNGPLASGAAGPRPSPREAAWLASDAVCFSKLDSKPPREARGFWENAILSLLPHMSHSRCRGHCLQQMGGPTGIASESGLRLP